MALTFPPMMQGQPVDEDAFTEAQRQATLGCDAGLITYGTRADVIEAALILSPEVPLSKAMAMLPLCAVGFQNALGALAPPEVSVHLEWDGKLRVNGASCGAFDVAASTDDPNAEPDWIVVGFRVPFLPESDEMGHTPDRTALAAEGCADVAPDQLIESWARHTLHWINRWETDGPRGVHTEWRGLSHGIGEDVTQSGLKGTFMGIDEDFGMLLKDENGQTHLLPLTTLLKGQA
ncbi:biotin/lipoate--protein ligase family protein [Yoonia litorea]|uniref:Biotin-(Acetyl-CoA carboxylase) ligase n=1 Tax=Yoonia litorea TaxID=1123755 RepID=A0A1I6MWB7_9RHOB|nr:biotin/lipoate--protein ligase family protein [Yoonia litorea]SFS19944.1 Biotin-(acetyl-CoA carboxylase) ligase [Yoonia litorea]